ncbi:MAG: agmatine deiminase [Pseudomonadota bacterium]
MTTPVEEGYRMPGEFEPHDACWMIFPERTDVWGFDPSPSQRVFVDVAAAISEFEPVNLCVSDQCYDIAGSMISGDINLVKMSTNDAWMRDCGPTFVINDKGDVAGVDWEFNAWGGELGGLYTDWSADNRVAEGVLKNTGARRFVSELVNEGGAIHVDGEGTLITTRSVLLNPNRNPGLGETEIENIFRDYLGVEKTIWLDVSGEDETDGHVDGLCAFVKPGVVLVAWHNDPTSEEYAEYQSVYDQLSRERDAKGRSLEIIKLPLATLPAMSSEEAALIEQRPGTYPRNAGDYVWGGYINFYIANGGIVYPRFGVEEDDAAEHILQQAFPDRKVVGVDGCRAISMCGGIIHCITQQQPSGSRFG